MPDEELRIISVELPEESLESYRVQHKDGSGRYSVVLRLSRAADEYERLYIGGGDWSLGEDRRRSSFAVGLSAK